MTERPLRGHLVHPQSLRKDQQCLIPSLPAPQTFSDGDPSGLLDSLFHFLM